MDMYEALFWTMNGTQKEGTDMAECEPKEIPQEEVTRLRDLTRDQLCDILEANTKTLNGMVKKYNALLTERNELQDENAELRKAYDELHQENERLTNECMWYRQNKEKQNGADVIVAILKAVADNNMQIHIEPRKLFDE